MTMTRILIMLKGMSLSMMATAQGLQGATFVIKNH